MSSWNKAVRKINKTNSIFKDIKALINLLAGDGKYTKRRVENKVKGKIIRKTIKF